MQSTKLKMLLENAMLATIYALLTVVISPLSYGGIQMRLSEILLFCAFYRSHDIPGLVLGCLIANLFSPMGLPDVIFGSFATLVACLGMWKLHNLYLAAVAASLVNGLIVGLELHWILGLPFWISLAEVAIGEGIVLWIGAMIFQKIGQRLFR